MTPYYARFASGEAQGVDAFSVSWRKGKGFFHPPVGLISRVVRKAERERAQGLLIVPDWPGSGLMLVLEDRVRMRKIRLVKTFNPVLECPREILSDQFRGVPKFDFNVFGFEF